MSAEFSERGLGLVRDEVRTYGRKLSDVAAYAAPAGPTVTRNRDVWAPKAWDQKRSNQCVGFSGARAQSMALAAALSKDPGARLDPNDVTEYSPTFGWWNAKDAGDKPYNVGVTITSYVRAAKSYGQAMREIAPFEVSKDDYVTRYGVRPSAAAYENASRHQLLDSLRVDDGDVAGILAAIDAGYPAQFGYPIFESFEDTGSDGIVKPHAGKFRGWHAMVFWDLDVINGKQYAVALNSWGAGFGKSGWLHFDVDALARTSDVWVYTQQEMV